MYTRTASLLHTEWDLQILLGTEKTVCLKCLNLKKMKENPQKVLIVASFNGDDEKQNTLASKTNHENII